MVSMDTFMLGSAMAQNQREMADEYDGAIAEYKALVAQLLQNLAVEQAHAAGLQAELDAMKRQHPNSPLLAEGFTKFRDGTWKSVNRANYEAAFDASLRKAGISNQEQFRKN